MISVKNLRKTFGTHEVLKGIDLSVDRGDVAVLIGPSGCGKSTLLRCLDLLEQPTQGEIEVAGNRLDFHPKSKFPERVKADFRRKTGMVFQGFHLFPHMTVLQNVMSGPLLNKLKTKEQSRDLAMRLLHRVGLADKVDLLPQQISGGQAQRVAIARALALEPEVMLFDEPTSALDPELVGEVLDVMQGLAADGTTMIVVTHEMSFARNVASKVIFMEAGHVVETGAPDEVLHQPKTDRLKSFLSKVEH
ncbi:MULTISPECIES: amino acid ABC transporter ATP-binding protein [Brucella/Ochrobactrum group]|jgi:cystine transport system ATP-binding protein|uniref:amino acid ABC transporter ATP-binding protein n=1 Tax=Brucella/Ochrobactrum group TaxID=2826938 RepID=UPI001C05B95B|nr:amino acid ABC transporter ATP-binding protein [Brucella sp. NBRC 12950]QWK81341.1 amino acid ABC transporter ATP-binding protein [Ochrobactrum sp. BTU1]GLU29994.1 arginine ABC transporter ATP-binding protein [Brucella sp. NBRC 12950]